MAEKTYYCKGAVIANGKLYPAGSTVPMDEKYAEPHIGKALDLIKEQAKPKAAAPRKAQKPAEAVNASE